jgi:transketolase
MNDIENLSVNTLRFLALDAVQRAQSGHPGTPMGIAPMAYVLWTRFLHHSPTNPEWVDRDRFVLSSGHASALLYALLHLTGYDLPLDEVKNFRQWGSLTPGHPEVRHVPGVETTTGPLGQGFANAVGMAIAEAHLGAIFNKPDTPEIVDHHTYVILSDGDLMEGIASEAASLAGHLRLGKLVALYDDNRISIEGSTEITFSEDRLKRFEAFGWHVQQVEDGNDLDSIEYAIRKAKLERNKPSIVAIHTEIAFGAPTMQGKAAAHAGAFADQEVVAAKEALGWSSQEAFYIPDEVRIHFRKAVKAGEAYESQWSEQFDLYLQKYPKEAGEFQRRMRGELPEGWEAYLPNFSPDPVGDATRLATGGILSALAPVIPELMGGSADLAPATQTLIKNSSDFGPDHYAARNLRFGVREHAMAGIVNGLALHGGIRSYGATFLVFYDYMRPAVRLAGMMNLPSIFIFTHDSVGLGEDGPTHQPIEQIFGLRSVPNLTCIRPCDQNEVVEAWRIALKNQDGPTCILLTRQPLPVLDRNKYAPAVSLQRGAYILSDRGDGNPDVLLMSTGSEVHVVLEAQKQLAEQGVWARVVAMPSWEIFMKQTRSYRESVLPPTVKARVAIEAGSTLGWERWVGTDGAVIGLDHFGASAPWKTLYQEFGLTAENVAKTAVEVIQRVERVDIGS